MLLKREGESAEHIAALWYSPAPFNQHIPFHNELRKDPKSLA